MKSLQKSLRDGLAKLLLVGCIGSLIGIPYLASAQPDDSDSSASEPRWSMYFQVSGGIGFSSPQKKEALKGYPESELTVAAPTLYAHARLGYMVTPVSMFWKKFLFNNDRLKVGPVLDVSYYRTSYKLEELGEEFGTFDSNWIMVSPGLGFVFPAKSPTSFLAGGSGFIGIVGFGIVQSEFSNGPYLDEIESQTGVYEVDVENGFALSILPMEYMFLLSRNISIGLNLTTLMFANPETKWYANGVINELLSKKINLMNSQYMVTVGFMID